ncbi:hypothetical protein SCLCIDRAFT_33956 [Scleroderma citrinum Foug A]|uniref:Uncharacterized protein n=1 Tax=Scleroderma citrinum Foug A TaxID=1036808 RepID=A0A0C3D335_9AGAM|nr:hypothetical protein SCLCIDRAFT_33956 [Scleroderma citrinum Foug A]
MASSVVIDIVPRLPLHPGFEGFQVDRIAFRFDAATSTLGSNDPIGTYGGVSTWLGSLSTSQVSRLVFLRCFVTDPLDLGLYRFRVAAQCGHVPVFHVDGSVYRPNSNVSMGIWVAAWPGHIPGSILILPRPRRRLTSPYGRSAGRIGGLDDIVDAAAAFRVITVTVVTVTSTLIAITLDDPLAFETWCNRLISALKPSKDEISACGVDRRTQWLRCRDFAYLRGFRLVSIAVGIHMCTQHVRKVPAAVWLVWVAFHVTSTQPPSGKW